jgi:hypothetical protein
LRLDSRGGFLKGGDSGKLVTPGNADTSLLVQVIRQSGPIKMPQGGKLSQTEISAIVDWVRMGAPWPDSGGVEAEKGTALWSLEPVRDPRPPKVKRAGWVVNPIDSFVLAQLESRRLKPSPGADRRTLIRRVTYDLTGLLPTPLEVDGFLKDKAANAYEKVVDRLLASPRYGERLGRHWLDVARYADTKGYVFNEDRNYPNAYTYRDWVIRSFNSDLPFDQFIKQQLAADLLPEVQSGQDEKPLAALGFLTLGRRFLNSTPDVIDDRIDTTMRGFEGFTVACARCHDHKFDPIPTQDYYSLYAVFNSSQEKDLPISGPKITDPWEKHNREVGEVEGETSQIVSQQVALLRKEVLAVPSAPALSSSVVAALQATKVGDPPAAQNLAVLTKAFEPVAATQLEQLDSKLTDLRQSSPAAPEFAMAMIDRPDASDGVVFKRGNAGRPGEVAPRRFLLALSKPGVGREHWTHGSGRLQLAQAIASRDNPLTARVFVNRLWLYDFGAGIVRTPSDFGHQGEKPTDPDLLDFLASSFMRNGWSIKNLERMIVTSATYRQSSQVSPSALSEDPENRDWGRMNRKRLDLEEMRDSLEAVSGHLDVSAVGGRSVDLWAPPFTGRRAVYGFIERQNLPGIFRVFDFATPDATSPNRFQTTTPQQALFFMNSPLSVDDAQSVANLPAVASSKDDAQRVRRLYRILFDRAPDPDELALGVLYLDHTANAPVPSPSDIWKFGYGGYDAQRQAITSFSPLKNFANGSYRFSDRFPDPQLGYASLSAGGGHPGRDLAHGVIRRWTAPISSWVTVDGMLAHRQKDGDGVRGRVISSRKGLLGEWIVHRSTAKTSVGSFYVQKGDTLDFVVDPRSNDGFDSFEWAPTIRSADGKSVWSSANGFGAPAGAPLSRLALYAQALMMTNEFMFID